MNGELNFEAMPFGAYETLAPEQSGFELEEEFGRRARSRSRGFAPRVMSKRPGPPPAFRPGTRKKPPAYPPRFPHFPPRWPWRPVVGYGVVPEPYPAEPLPAGSEHMRWVQSALNDVLGLRLPVNGVADSATRSAIRSFQQREGLPADGTVGPDTERALIAARRGQSSRGNSIGASGSDMAEPLEPAAAPAQPVAAEAIELALEPLAEEFGFEWENFPEFESLSPACKPEPGEVAASRTSAGILTKDVEDTTRGILVADFGIDWRSVKDKAKRELAPWIRRFETDPTITAIRISGFTDCIGPGGAPYHERLRRARALRVRDLLGPVARKKVKFVGPAPVGTFFGPNTDRAGRAKNRSVLIEFTRTVTIEPTVVKACQPATKGVTSALSRVIPDDPDYRKHIPLNYRLNAKKLVGEVAQDLSSRGKSAHFWIELAHWGIVLAEMFELAGALAIASPILGTILTFLALGEPYRELAEEIAAEWSARGFSRGVVMGADGRSAKLLKEYFGSDYIPPYSGFPRGRAIAMANYRMGLLVGYALGRVLCPNQRAIFWRDLGRRMGDQSYRGPRARWTKRDWINWYVDSAAVFTSHHL
jgi:outer membrane protein OmpA-like peptidoglycan-associated protein